jgi:hypothetical protein
MNDFDVVTGPAPGSAAKLQPAVREVPQKSGERSAVSPPSQPSAQGGRGKESSAG